MSTKDRILRWSPVALLVFLGVSVFLLRHSGEDAPESSPAVPQESQKKETDVPGKLATQEKASEDPSYIAQVVSPSRQPIYGARVFRQASNPKEATLATTDETGHFRISTSLVDSSLWVHILADGFAPKRWKLDSVRRDFVPEIVLARSVALEGVLLEADTWRGIEGARIEAVNDAYQFGSAFWSMFSGARGTFTADCIPREGLILRVAGGWVMQHGQKVATGDGRPVHHQEIPDSIVEAYKGRMLLAARRSGTLEVEVQNEDGEPVPNAFVASAFSTTTNEEGMARLKDLYPGKRRFIVKAEGYPDFYDAAIVKSGETVRIKVGLTQWKARVVGKVIWSEAQPRPVRVTAGVGEAWSRRSHSSTLLDEEDRYSLWVPHDTPLRLKVFFTEKERGNGPDPWIDRETVRLGFGQTLKRDLAVDPTGRLTVTVTDADRRLLEGALVTLKGHTGEVMLNDGEERDRLSPVEARMIANELYGKWYERHSDAGGKVIFYLPAGYWELHAEKRGYIQGEPLKTQTTGPDHEARLELLSSVDVVGRVIDVEGKSLVGYKVRVGEPREITDGQGRFQFSDLSPGIHTFWVFPPNHPLFTYAAVLQEDVACQIGMGEVTLQVPYMQRIIARLTDTRILESGEVNLSFFGPRGAVTGMSLKPKPSPDGVYVTAPAPAGEFSYRLTVTWKNPYRTYDAARGSVTVLSQQDSAITITPSPPAKLSVDLEIPDTAVFHSYSGTLFWPGGLRGPGSSAKNTPGTGGMKRFQILAAVGEYDLEVVGEENVGKRGRRGVRKTVLYRKRVILGEGGATVAVKVP